MAYNVKDFAPPAAFVGGNNLVGTGSNKTVPGTGMSIDSAAFVNALQQIEADSTMLSTGGAPDPAVGGAIYVPAGVYVLSHPIWLYRSVLLYGDGMRTSTLMFNPSLFGYQLGGPGWLGSGIIIQGQKRYWIKSPGDVELIGQTTPMRTVIRDLSLLSNGATSSFTDSMDGNPLAHPTCGIIACSGFVSVEGCEVTDFDADGIHLNSSLPRWSSFVVNELPVNAQPDLRVTERIGFTKVPTGGKFTLSFRGETTTDISFNATPAEVQEALEQLTTIGHGNVQVTTNDPPVPEWVWNVQFGSGLNGLDVPLLSGDASGLLGVEPVDVEFKYAGDAIVDDWNITNCFLSLNGRHGVFLFGIDSNAGCAINLHSSDNKRCGIFDGSPVGNTYMGGDFENNPGGHINIPYTGNASLLANCYVETMGELPLGKFGGLSMIIGSQNLRKELIAGTRSSLPDMTILQCDGMTMHRGFGLGLKDCPLQPSPHNTVKPWGDFNDADCIALVDSSLTSGTVQLPGLGDGRTFGGNQRRVYTVKNVARTGVVGNDIDVEPSAGETIDGNMSYRLKPGDWLTVIGDWSATVDANRATWHILSHGPTVTH